jgi:hypothetical protein
MLGNQSYFVYVTHLPKIIVNYIDMRHLTLKLVKVLADKLAGVGIHQTEIPWENTEYKRLKSLKYVVWASTFTPVVMV